jgi:uncharacterized protein (TIRG00374 family)
MEFANPPDAGLDDASRHTGSHKPWNRAKLLFGLRIFIALTLAVVFVLLLRGNLKENFDALLTVSLFAIWIGLGQSVFDLLGGGARLWFVSRAFGGRIGLLPCVRANGANIFIGGLTPSQTGGGPAQIYTLVRSGLDVPIAVVTSFIAYMCTIVALLGFGLLMVWSGPPRAIDDGYGTFLRLGATLLGSFLLLLVAALPRPGIYQASLERIRSRIPWAGRRIGSSAFLATVSDTLDTSSLLLRQVRPRGALMILAGSVMTILVYLNKFVVAYVTIRAMGLEADLLEVIFLQWVLYLVLYFAPTPGASGVAELSAVAIMGPLLPSAHFGAFVVLWRSFSLYVPMALSGILLLCRFPHRRWKTGMKYGVERSPCQSLSIRA